MSTIDFPNKIDKDLIKALRKRYILPEPLKSETHEERHILTHVDHMCNWKRSYKEYQVWFFDASLSTMFGILEQGGKVLMIKRHHPLYGGFLIFKVWKE